MTEKIFFYIDQPSSVPVNVLYNNISNIDNYEDNSIDHIMINDLLDFYTIEISPKILNLLYQKLKTSGLLEIQGLDLKELSLAMAKNAIEPQEAQALLYRNNRKCMHSIYDIESMLKNIGLDILQKKYINMFEYYILAKKNEK